jgi:hypothetical protein
MTSKDEAVLVRLDGTEVSDPVDVEGARFVLRDGVLHLEGSWTFKLIKKVKAGEVRLRVRALDQDTVIQTDELRKGWTVTVTTFTLHVIGDGQEAQ